MPPRLPLGGGVIVPPLKQVPLIGYSKDPTQPAVYGQHTAGGIGVSGLSDTGTAVYGWAMADDSSAPAIHGKADGNGQGLYGESINGEGIHGETKSVVFAAIAGFNRNSRGTGAAIYGEKAGTEGHAGYFVGNVHVTGLFHAGQSAHVAGILSVDQDITLNNAADCAEDFDIHEAETVEAGTVMVLGEGGVLYRSQKAYDKRVAGVISGAGDYRTGILLDKQALKVNRKPLALLGKVFCKVDADCAPIEVGDLLTTSDTPGHAMKADDSGRAFGSIMGKALRAVSSGQRLIPILITLQ